GAADRAHGEPVVEGKREIAGGDEQGGERDLDRVGALDGVDDFGDVDAAKHVIEHIARDTDNGDADHHTQLVQDLLVAQERDGPAYGFQHLDLEYRCDGSGRQRTSPPPSPALAPSEPLVARFGAKRNSPDG